MLNIKKTLAVAGIATTLGVAGIGGLGVASAATDTSGDDKSSLITKLADKFHLNKSEVQAVFDEHRTEHEAKRQQQLEERLTQAVKDGKLTEEQKTKILAKVKEMQAEMQANRDAAQDKTKEERRAAMEQKREALEQWAKDNNVPLRYLKFGFGPHGHGQGPMSEKPFDAPSEQQ